MAASLRIAPSLKLLGALAILLTLLTQGCAHAARPPKTAWGDLPPDTATLETRVATYQWRAITKVDSNGMVVGGKQYSDAAIGALFHKDEDRIALSVLRRSHIESRFPSVGAVLIPFGAAIGAMAVYFTSLSNTGATYTSDTTVDFSHTVIFSTATSQDYTRGALVGAAVGTLVWLGIAVPLWYAGHHGRYQAAEGYDQRLFQRLKLGPGQAGLEIKF
jgi:hypothetical protein